MKKTILFLMLSLFSFILNAESIDKLEALKVAKTMMPETELIDLSSRSNYDNFYIFSGENAFVIVSADDRVTPILAYSNEFPFVVEEMPENLREWLSSLEDEIQYAIDNDIVASEEIMSDWNSYRNGNVPDPKNRTSVSPLVSTHWDQGEPYNDLCPGGSVTGCVATAMAQVMKYWEWPRQGEGSHSYYENNYGNLSVNFANTTYDWDNMVDKPTASSPQVQKTAVATLMYHCGVSIDMDYSPSGSGAYTTDVKDALETYFDYNAGIQINYKSNYTNSQWKNMLKSELNQNHPIVYSGRNSEAGHCFVCDGYDASDYFHFNWGWGGSCDGYYAIGALNPGSGGTGSGSGTYNEYNYVLIGIQPNTPSINPPSNLTATVDGEDVNLSWSSVSNAHHYKVYRDGFVIDNNVSGTSFTDNEVAYGVHTYFVKSVNSNGNYSIMSDVVSAEVLFSGPIPTNLTATQSGMNDVQLSWTAPACENATLKYGDGQPSGSSYGSPDYMSFYWGERFSSEQLSNYAGMAINSVQTYINYSAPYVLYIYKVVDGEMQIMHTKNFNVTNSGWQTVTLDSPIILDYCNDLMIVIHNNTIEYPAPYMNYNGSDDASLYSIDGTSYYSIGNISWLIKTNITDGTYTYNIYRDGSVIASNKTQTSYTDTNLDYGTYQYTVSTNYYGGTSEQSAPATVTVTEPESYTVTLSSTPSDAGSTSGEGTYVEGSSVTVSATPNNGYFFEKWTENGSQVSTNANYTFTITSDRNLVAHFSTNNLSVNVTDTNNPSCNGGSDGSITISVNGGVPPYTYQIGDRNIYENLENHTFNNLCAGGYEIEVTDASGYMVSTTAELDEPDGLTVGEIASGEEVICEGESASTINNVMEATSDQGGLTYRWKKNGELISNSNSSSYTPSSLAVGTYTFTREVMDNCTDWTESEGSWILEVNEIPTISIEGETIIMIGESTTLTANGADSYLWSTGETSQSIIVSPTEETSYSVVGTTYAGCMGEAEITIIVEPDAIDENDVNTIEIYPNPTKDKVNIVCKGMKDVSILSITGQIIGYEDVNDDNIIIDLQKYPKSVLIFVINKNDGTIIRRNVIHN